MGQKISFLLNRVPIDESTTTREEAEMPNLWEDETFIDSDAQIMEKIAASNRDFFANLDFVFFTNLGPQDPSSRPSLSSVGTPSAGESSVCSSSEPEPEP